MNILGVGGHAKVVIDAVQMAGMKVSAVYDDNEELSGNNFCGFKVAGTIDNSVRGLAIIAIGSNRVRQIISKRLYNVNWETVCHPKAIVADDVEIGEGSIIMAGAVIQPGTRIGRHCIINTGTCIDHDCIVGDFAHVAPNCSIAGGVSLGAGIFIGIGTSIVQYLNIGDWATVGAGSAVINDIPSGCTAVGVPAKPIKFHQNLNKE